MPYLIIFQALFHAVIDCICFALWMASFVAPWRIYASVDRVGAKISRKGFRKVGLATSRK